MSDKKEVFRNLPGVDRLLASPELKPLLSSYGKDLVTFAVRQSLDLFREEIRLLSEPPRRDQIIARISAVAFLHGRRHLRKVYNATGIIIHTNLGRAPFSTELLNETFEVLNGYSNLEFNLDRADRGDRNDHASSLLRYLTGAEDILVVNNAASAVMMILRSFARNREVIVSRGELVEIGGSFRVPEIMAASDSKMVEVGTTNKTRLSDYENAITRKTALLFKAHKSNYAIKGFTEEVSVADLAGLGRKHGLPVLYDMGSGLLRKVSHPALLKEPNVRETLSTGVDVVCFSGDKLLGGPQAGIIAGRKAIIDRLKKEPMLRALRVCKTTIALLETACSYYLNDEKLKSGNYVFRAFYREKSDIHDAARELKSLLEQSDIGSEIIPSKGQCGGGSIPEGMIDSFAVLIRFGKTRKEMSGYSERLYHELLQHEKPLLGVLKQGKIMFDLLTIDRNDIPLIGKIIAEVHDKIVNNDSQGQ